MKLTKRLIDSFKYEGKAQGKGMSRDVRWDTRLSGFGVRIFPPDENSRSRKTFILSYRAHGRKRLLTIGAYGVLTLDQARGKAKSLLGKVIDGKDPLQERQTESKGKTVRELCEAFISRFAKIHKKSWKTDQSRINKYILRAFGRHKVRSITQSDVTRLHQEIGETKPYEANRNLALISKIFSIAIEWGYLDKKSDNPAHNVKRFKETERDRFVSEEELPRLTQAIDNVDNVYARASLWLYLLTGARKTELLGSRWVDINLTRGELRLPDTKAGKTRYIPLSSAAIAILQNLPRLDGNPFVLPGARKARPLVNIDKTWRKVRKEAGVEDVRLHDLRRTVGSWLAQGGSSLHLIGRVLGHSNESTTKIYARFGQDHLKDALEVHGKKIMEIAGKQAVVKAEVIEMPVKQKRKTKKAK